MMGFKSIGIAAGLGEIASQINNAIGAARANKIEYGPKMALDYLIRDLEALRRQLWDTSDEIAGEPDRDGVMVTPEWRELIRNANQEARKAKK